MRQVASILRALHSPSNGGRPDSMASIGGRPLSSRMHASLAELDQEAWNALFPGSVEGYELYRGLEAVPPPGFTLGGLSVSDGARLIAAAPLFQSDFRLDGPFQGQGDTLAARLASKVSFKTLGIGSPMSDNCSIGFAPGLSEADRAAARIAVVDGLFSAGKAAKAQILVVKSLGPETPEWHDLLTGRGFGCIRSVPTVTLPLPYANLEHYFASLPDKTGSYLKRKLRAEAKLRIEYRTSIAGIADKIMALHDATLAQSSVDYGEFDKLHPNYFTTLLDSLGDRAKMMLCWKDGELLSFQVFLIGKDRIIANKIGMKYPEARDYNLYFVNWLKMIEMAIERGIPEIEMGATTYAAKILFGGKLDTRWIYFKLRAPGVTRLSRPLHKFFDFERNDPELQRLAKTKAAGPAP